MSDHTSKREESGERSPWSRPSVLISAAFLLALALLGVVVAATSNSSSTRGQLTRTLTTAGQASQTPATATADACELPAAAQKVPSSSPPPAQWETVGSMQVPQNPAVFGPQRSAGPWNTCFAHDPSGALLAAMNFWAEGTAVAPNDLFARLAVGAPRNLGSNTRLDSGGPVQFAGYRYDSYTPSQAQIAVVFRGPEGKLLAVACSMVWSGGDWKYQFPTHGTPAMQVIADLTGYVPWTSF
jgi:hypothetical protein